MENSHSPSSKQRSKATDYTQEDFLRLLILFNEQWIGSSTPISTTCEPALIISSSLTQVKLSSMTPKMVDLASYRLRPEAYGTDITKFFYQVPVTDITRTNMSDLESMQTIGERITGINEQMFGGISKSRTTATEVRTSTGFGVN